MLSTLIDAITGLAKDELKRNERVIKLLKQFNLDPDHPPSEFTGIYRYALVEYGVGKPPAILQLFRLEVIQKAFRQAFEADIRISHKSCDKRSIAIGITVAEKLIPPWFDSGRNQS